MDLVKPFALKRGDKIGIVAPSLYIINEKAFDVGLDTLKELGFEVEVGQTVRSKYRKSQIDPAIYKEQLELMEIALDVAKITEGLNRVRNKK